MKNIKYKFLIDPDVIKEYKIYNTTQVSHLVGIYLNDPEGWSKHGYFFEPVDYGEQVLIRMVSRPTIKKECGLPDDLSCAVLGGKYMYINSYRWFYGAAESQLPLNQYRQYVISHEIGHILGHEHKHCPCKGCPAPIMMQQTKGISSCKPNTSVN